MGAATGTNILALADGVVLISEFNDYDGNLIYIYYGEDENGNHLFSTYMHLQDTNNLEAGDYVKKGDTVGHLGGTGGKGVAGGIGPHLHFEIRINSDSNLSEDDVTPERYINNYDIVHPDGPLRTETIGDMPLDPLQFDYGKENVKLNNNNNKQNVTLCWPLPENANIAWVSESTSSHIARDIGVPEGTDVYATESGIVVLRYDPTGALYIYHGKNKDGKALLSRYVHMSKTLVSVGDEVDKGQKIGEVGNKPGNMQDHLHFEMGMMDNFDLNSFIESNKNNALIVDNTYTEVDPFNYKYDYEEKIPENKRNTTRYKLEITTPAINSNNSKSITLDGMVFLGDSILGSYHLKSLLEKEGAKVFYKVGLSANYYLGKTNIASSTNCKEINGNQFDWEGNFSEITNPTGFFLELGTNGLGPVSDFQELVQKIQENYPNTPIFILPVMQRLKGRENGGEAPELDTNTNNSIDRFNEQIKMYCDEIENVFFCDVTEGFNALTMQDITGFHPTNNGQDVILNNIKKYLSNISVRLNNSKDDSENKNVQYEYIVKVARVVDGVSTVGGTSPLIMGNGAYVEVHKLEVEEINYKEYVGNNTMPFNYIWAMLLIGQDKQFALDLADLAYDSNIELTIKDNVSDIVAVTNHTHKMKYEYTLHVTKCQYSVFGETITDTKNDYYPGSNSPRTVTEPRSNMAYIPVEDENSAGENGKYYWQETNKYIKHSIDVSLTLADTWCEKFEEEYKSEPTSINQSNSRTQGDTYFKSGINDDEDVIFVAEGEDKGNLLTEYLEWKEESIKTYGYIKRKIEQGLEFILDEPIEVISYSTEYTKQMIDREVSVKVTGNGNEYRTKKIVEDEEESEQKFIKLFRENYNARSNILSAKEWLYKILESNDNTVDLVDKTKELIYKAIDKEDEYISKNTKSDEEKDANKSGITGVPGKVFDFFLEKGYSPVAIAAIMGNIDVESGFYNLAIGGGLNEAGESIPYVPYGLCQWLSSEEQASNAPLFAYARRKGSSWTDIDTQIEYLYDTIIIDHKFQNMDEKLRTFTEVDQLEEATWYFCRYYEVPSTTYNDYETYKKDCEAGICENSGMEDVRIERAKKWYEQWKIHDSGRTTYSYYASKNILANCEVVAKELYDNGIVYSLSNLAWNNIERSGDFTSEYNGKRRIGVCCATYVTVVLYRSGLLKEDFINNHGYNAAYGVDIMLEAAGWITVDKEEIQPGDVCVYWTKQGEEYPGHAFIYAGGDEIWDQSCGCISSGGTKGNKQTISYWNYYWNKAIEMGTQVKIYRPPQYGNGVRTGMGGTNIPTSEVNVRGEYLASTGKVHKLLLNEPEWKDKCNRYACAAIVSGYSDETASELIDTLNDYYYINNNHGTILGDTYWNHYGLEIHQESINKNSGDNYTEVLKRQLENGGYALIWINGNGINDYRGKNKERYLGPNGVHWMAVIDYRNINGKFEMYIMDSMCGQGWYDLDEFTIYGLADLWFVNEL